MSCKIHESSEVFSNQSKSKVITTLEIRRVRNMSCKMHQRVFQGLFESGSKVTTTLALETTSLIVTGKDGKGYHVYHTGGGRAGGVTRDRGR